MKPDTCYRDNVRMFKIHGIHDQDAEEKEEGQKKHWKITQLKMYRFAEGFKYTGSRHLQTLAR